MYVHTSAYVVAIESEGTWTKAPAHSEFPNAIFPEFSTIIFPKSVKTVNCKITTLPTLDVVENDLEEKWGVNWNRVVFPVPENLENVGQGAFSYGYNWNNGIITGKVYFGGTKEKWLQCGRTRIIIC